jgi:two-component system cell cycle response regulator DivK
MAGDRILVIEDNKLNAKLLRDVLGSRGYSVLEALTAEDGIEIARNEQPALILMDIQLPGMNGIEALQVLGDDPATAHIPVMAVTASVMPMERDEIMAAGFAGYQAKPISVVELVTEVRSLLGEDSEADGAAE